MPITVQIFRPSEDDLKNAKASHATFMEKEAAELKKAGEAAATGAATAEANKEAAKAGGKLPGPLGTVFGGAAGTGVGKLSGVLHRGGNLDEGAPIKLHEQIVTAAKGGPVVVVYGTQSNVKTVTDDLDKAGVKNATVILVDMQPADKKDKVGQAIQKGVAGEIDAGVGTPQVQVYKQGSAYDAKPVGTFNARDANLTDELKGAIEPPKAALKAGGLGMNA